MRRGPDPGRIGTYRRGATRETLTDLLPGDEDHHPVVRSGRLPGIAPFDFDIAETCFFKQQQDLLGEIEVLVEVVGLFLDDLTPVPQASTHLQRLALQERIEFAKSKEHLDLVAVGGCAALTLGRPFARDVGSMTGEPPWLFLQVITESRMTILDIEAVRTLAATEIEVSRAVAAHLLRRLREAYRLIAVRTLGNIKERVAYDLLDRAAQSQLVVGRLEVTATQADLADSVGSSREVMSRALRELRVEGIVETAPGAIRVLDPTRLAATVRTFVI